MIECRPSVTLRVPSGHVHSLNARFQAIKTGPTSVACGPILYCLSAFNLIYSVEITR